MCVESNGFGFPFFLKQRVASVLSIEKKGATVVRKLLFPIVLYQKKEKVKKQTENHFKYIQRKSQKQ
uniref:Uncharacterized protein n=1 Tax=Populus trichocarpa TaxID=3694 RepID=A0A3N7EXY3_POPTR